MDEAKTARKNRLVRGVGVGGTSGVAVAILAGWLYTEQTGKMLDQEVAMAMSALIGSVGSTVAICLQEIKDIIWEFLRQRRKDAS